MTNKPKVGGKRQGAGMKHSSKAGSTKPKRVPLKYIDIVDELIATLDASAEHKNKKSPLTSEEFNFKSASGELQSITFTIKAR